MTTQRANLTPYLRGVGTQNGVVGEEGTVPIYVDGILVTSLMGAAFSLPNVERVEILKGPQGTLFGRNAIGGLINVITREPSHTPLIEGSVTYGNYETIASTAYVTGGLSDTIAADLSAYFIDQGKGWGNNLTLGTDANKKDEFALRSKVLFTPTDDLKITIAGDFNTRDSSIGPTRSILPGTIAFGGVLPSGTIYDTLSQTAGSNVQEFKQWGVSGRIEYDIGSASIVSTTSYRSINGDLYFDQDSGPLLVVESIQEEENDTFQQELLINGSAGDFQYTAGLYYMDSKARFNYSLMSHFVPPQNTSTFSLQKTEVYSVFGQGEYEFITDTTLTAGLRYTKEKRQLTASQFAGPNFPFAPVGTLLGEISPETDPGAKISFEKLTWRLGIDHRLTEDVLFYASYSRGFKSGVFNVTNPFQAPVDPETLDAYEVGFKAEFYDRRIRLNASAFHYDYKNIQLVRATLGPPALLNATRGSINGLDVEVTYIPPLSTSSLLLSAGLSYIDAEYGDYPEGPITIPLPAGGNQQTTGDLSGHDMVRSPPVTLSLSGYYAVPTAIGEISLSASYYYNDGFFWEPDNRLKQGSYSLVNANIMLTSLDERWSFGIFCRNCSNTRYYSQVSAAALGDLASPASPRTYGATIKFKFGS